MPSATEMAKETRRREFRAVTQTYLLENNPAPKIIDHLKAILPLGGTVAAYRPLKNEISLEDLFGDANYRFLFPRMDGDDLQFYEVQNLNDFKMGSYGIRQPDPEKAKLVGIHKADVALVPGLAFDREGGRLGRGRGYFDRALRDFKGLKIGIAARVQICDEALPCNHFDVPMDIIVTDDFVLRFFKS